MKLDFTACKGSSISWYCCSAAATGAPGGCTTTSCNGVTIAAGGYCDTVLTSTINVVYGATFVTLQGERVFVANDMGVPLLKC